MTANFMGSTDSIDRVGKERAMRRRQLKWLCKRLREFAPMELPRDALAATFRRRQATIRNLD
jgi:hypothetical protein